MPASQLIRIDDPDDPRIAGYRDIRERDLVGRQGRFVAEGTVVLRLLVDAHARGTRFTAELILLLENRVAGLEEIVASVPAGIPVFVTSAAVMNAVAGFDIHRGVLALGRRTTMATIGDIVDRLPAHALVVAACGISNHDNIGAIFATPPPSAPTPCSWTKPAAIRSTARRSGSRSVRSSGYPMPGRAASRTWYRRSRPAVSTSGACPRPARWIFGVSIRECAWLF